MNKQLLLMLTLLIPVLGYTQRTTKKCFRLPPDLKEVSGLYLESGNSFWWLNDSGWDPILFNTNGRGELIDSICFPQLKNVDWEDLTSDDRGNIYIGDFGNNNNNRKDLRIYIYNKESEKLDSILYTYPDQKLFPPPLAFRNFNMEGFFWHKNKLHLFSKNRRGVGSYYTKHYTLTDQAGQQVATLKDSIYLKKRIVTGAAISPDGASVALLTYNFKKILGFLPNFSSTIYILRNFEEDNFLSGKLTKRRTPSFLIATQWESIDFLNNKTVYVASEQTAFIKPKVKRARLRKRNLK